MVWKSSTKLGIGLVKHKNKKNKNCYILVAVYRPQADKNDEALKQNVDKGFYKKRRKGFFRKVKNLKKKLRLGKKILG